MSRVFLDWRVSKAIPRFYIGDAVYVHVNSCNQLVLRTERYFEDVLIYLEPEVLYNLLAYLQSVGICVSNLNDGLPLINWSPTSPENRDTRSYIGDGVYARIALDQSLVLSTGHHDIFLELGVMKSLLEYLRSVDILVSNSEE